MAIKRLGTGTDDSMGDVIIVAMGPDDFTALMRITNNGTAPVDIGIIGVATRAQAVANALADALGMKLIPKGT